MGRFRDALAGPGLATIAEVKRRSPSAGDLRPGAEPPVLAAEFERAGAAAVSVLVDERFAGTVDDLRAARAAAALPLLAKGFFREEAQLDELREAGADCALLILRDLDDRTARGLMEHAATIGLDTLVEAHDACGARPRGRARSGSDRDQRARPRDVRDRPRRSAARSSPRRRATAS